MLEVIQDNHLIYGIIIKSTYGGEGIHFLTPNDFPMQLGYMKHSKGFNINPHIHNRVERKIFNTFETIYIKKGKISIDFYNCDKQHVLTRVVETGDIVLLAYGGHGFSMLEDSEFIEIKQGPYINYESDKTKIIK